MDRADIITLIKAQLDELSELPTDTPDTELIDQILDDVTLKFLKVAPIHLLEVDYFAPGSITNVDLYSCSIATPANFLRLVELRSSEWERAITELSMPPLYKNKYNAPGIAKPKAVLMSSATGAKTIRIAPQTTSIDSIANYIPERLPEEINDDTAIPGLAYMVAYEIFTILEDLKGAEMADKKFNEWILANKT